MKHSNSKPPENYLIRIRCSPEHAEFVKLGTDTINRAYEMGVQGEPLISTWEEVELELKRQGIMKVPDMIIAWRNAERTAYEQGRIDRESGG